MKRQISLFILVTLLVLTLGAAQATPARATVGSTFSDNGTYLDIVVEGGVSIDFNNYASTYEVVLSSNTWYGTDTANVTGAGTDTLTIANPAFSEIDIGDEGSGVSVYFPSSGGNTYSNAFVIDLAFGSSSVTVDDTLDLTSGALFIAADAIYIYSAVSTSNEDILFHADLMDIGDYVDSGGAIVTLEPLSNGQLIDLGGSDVAGTLGLSNNEIEYISTSILRIGSTDAGSIDFTDLISPAETSVLSLITGDEILNTHGGADVQVTSLAMQAVNGIGMDSQIDTDVDTLAARNTTAGGIAILEASSGGDLTVGTVDGVVGIRNEASTGFSPLLSIQLETNYGNLTVNDDIYTSRRNIYIVAQYNNGGSGDRTFTNNANITDADSGASASNGKIDIRANNMTLANGSAISAVNRVILEDDPDSTVTIAIKLGGSDGVNQLGLTDAELDTVSTPGILQIGYSGSGSMDVLAAIDLTDGPIIPTTELHSGTAITDSSGSVFTANVLNLIAGTSIGASGVPFKINATALTTTGVGNQYISEADSVTVGNGDMNAGGASIVLVSGIFYTTLSGGDIQDNTSVLSGATLGGTGAVGGAVDNYGSVAPGASPGILSTGNVSFEGFSSFNVEVNGVTTAGTDYDQLNVTGTVFIDHLVDLVISAGTLSGTVNGDTLVIINNDNTDAVGGTFSGLANGASLTIDGIEFKIYYDGGDGNDVVLVAQLPVVSLSAASLDFGDVLVGATSPAQTVTITNTGGDDLDIGILNDSGEFAVINDNCSNTTVAPGNNCTFDVTFSPLSLGPKAGSVSIPSNAPSSADSISLSGNGVSIPAGVNLLINPSFDQTAQYPRVWQYSVRRTYFASLLDCTYFISPDCSLKLVASGRTSIVTQTVNHSGLGGDMFIYGLSSAASNVPVSGYYRVEIALFNAFNRVMSTQLLNFTPGSHDWEILHDTFSAPANYNKMRFRFYFQKSGGTGWFDDAFLIQQ